MDFGKLSNVDKVDFSLPQITQRTIDALAKNSAEDLNVFIGGTGWGMKEWVGKYYPKGTKTKDFLTAYSKQFNTIELNTTHYRIPDFETIERWKKISSPDFRFCPKLPQSISHKNDLGLISGQMDAFIDSISGLDHKLGPCFMQLPPYFESDRLPILRNFIKAWPLSMRLAIEFRHESWFTEEINETLIKLFTEKQIIKLITDVAGRRDVLHLDIWQPFLLLRFVGNEFHPSDYHRMDSWISMMMTLKQLGLREIYIFAHQPDNIRAPEIIQYLLNSLSTKPGMICKPMQLDFNTQLPLF